MLTVEIIYRQHGLEAKPKISGELAGACPFCGGKDRFTIFAGQGKEGQGRYWCRKCNKSGDAIQLLRELYGLSFQDALKKIGLSEYIYTPKVKPVIPQAKKQDFNPIESKIPCGLWQEKAEKLIEWASEALANNPDIQKWLEVERGLNSNTIRKARLGWIPQDIYRNRENFGLNPEIKENGKARRIWIPKGLLIPVFNESGQILRVKFRVANHSENRPKYIPLPQNEKNTAPLVLENETSHFWQIVESELDGLLLMQESGLIVNVIALGSAAFKPDAGTWNKLLKAEKVLVSLDYDEAGNKSACQWWQKYLKPGQFKLWPVPEGKDPTDSFLAGWNLKDWTLAGLKNN